LLLVAVSLLGCGLSMLVFGLDGVQGT
jgi:hypothetical protein